MSASLVLRPFLASSFPTLGVPLRREAGRVRAANTVCRAFSMQSSALSIKSRSETRLRFIGGGRTRFLFTAQPVEDETSNSTETPMALTQEQKKILFISSAVPMIGFGFMDNMVMITMGEFIDSTMGVTFGLSTLTAAGFGQIFSDISGICFGGTVEAICTKMGLPTAKLTAAQAAMGQTKRVTTFGAVCGVTVGCLLGMSILLFKTDATEDAKHDAEFVKMLESDDKVELKEYVLKIKTELAQAEAALDATERMLEGNNSRKGLGEIKRWKSNRESSGDAKDK